ncbi:MAG TPA: type II toxin-antitoxin system Phd/YefM family antitoxin [Myxococcaceae bacterium]|nr:type II toxin-antitoxin system Phd/YefM family antitoxin [Myxococcaceae bacterium]
MAARKKKTSKYAVSPLPVVYAGEAVLSALRASAAGTGETVPAGIFKARCLALMDRVQKTGRSLVITKHGTPVARLSPVESLSDRPFVGRMRHSVEVTGDLVEPVAADWTVDADL